MLLSIPYGCQECLSYVCFPVAISFILATGDRKRVFASLPNRDYFFMRGSKIINFPVFYVWVFHTVS